MRRISAVCALGLVLGVATVASASSGIFDSFVIVNSNGGGNTYYDLSSTTGNPDWQGANLGSFNIALGNTLVLNGGEVKTFKNGTDDITAARTKYRIYETSAIPPLFSTVNLPFDSNLGPPGDQKWDETAAGINALAGLPYGTYKFEVYSEADFTFDTGSGTHFADNGALNYIATFAVVPEPGAIAGVGGLTGLLALRRRRR